MRYRLQYKMSEVVYNSLLREIMPFFPVTTPDEMFNYALKTLFRVSDYVGSCREETWGEEIIVDISNGEEYKYEEKGRLGNDTKNSDTQLPTKLTLEDLSKPYRMPFKEGIVLGHNITKEEFSKLEEIKQGYGIPSNSKAVRYAMQIILEMRDKSYTN